MSHTLVLTRTDAVAQDQPEVTNGSPHGQETTRAKDDFDVHIYDDFSDAQSIWRALEANGHGSVYQRFDWCKLWFSTFGDAQNLTPTILTVCQHGAPLILLPLVTCSAAFGVRIADFMGGKHGNVRLPLLSAAPKHADAIQFLSRPGVLSGLVSGALKQAQVADFAALTCMPAAFGELKNPFASSMGGPCIDQLLVGELHTDFEALVTARRSPGYAKKLRKKRRALADGRNLTFARAETQDDVTHALAVFFQQKAERFRSAGIRNPFEASIHRRFTETLALESLENRSGLLDIFTLKKDREIVAVFAAGHLGSALSGSLISMSLDPKVARSSPGEIIVHDLVERLCTHGFSTFDLGLGEAARYKQGWCEPARLGDVNMTITLRGFLARLAWASIKIARTFVLKRPKLAMKIRQALNLLHQKRLTRPLS
ncbi:MAG: GNAT family N-acetyltransferase [Pseudomonadota bacterium]